MGSLAAAIRDFSKVLEKETSYPNLYNRGVSYLAVGQKNRAKADLTRALRIIQKEAKELELRPKYDFDLALLYLANGEIEQARRRFRAALEVEYNLRWLFEALRNLDQFIVLFPGNQPAGEIRKLLGTALEAKLSQLNSPS